MACVCFKKSATLNENSSCVTNWNECFKGLDQYRSDDELAQVLVFLNYPDWLLMFTAVCCIIFMIIGIPGNLITIIALIKYRKIRNATAIFIINLSVADLLYSVIILPLAIELLLKESWTTGRAMCRLFAILNYGLFATSTFTVVAITINRYVMVAHPKQYPKMYQTRNLTIMIICLWLGAFGQLVPVMFEWWGLFSLDPIVGFCTIIPDTNGNSPKTLLVVMGFVFPTSCIVVFYGLIWYHVKKSTSKAKSSCPPGPKVSDSSGERGDEKISTENDSSTQADSQEDTNYTNDISRTESAVTKFKRGLYVTFRPPRRLSNCPTQRDKRLRSMILAIFVSFFLTRLPIMVSKTAHDCFADSPYGNMVGYILIYMTVCINPITYVAMSREYRQAYRHLIRHIFGKAMIR